MDLDKMDARLLDYIQSGLPVSPEPYREMASVLDTNEEDIIARLRRLIDMGIIRRLGAVFDSRKVGYTGTLCAMKVPTDRITEVAGIINAFPGITHNYLRDHDYNMWFTLLAESQENIGAILDEIRKKTGIADLIDLPAEHIFKIRVNFDLSEE
ncbi:MAG: transcriptional regulator [Peptococcaceae bacterium BRH_c4b]|nr:MAG: transcriptional regulator [Peptococcaceae bacterium BRH_c4b]